jgi:hypothetical protein
MYLELIVKVALNPVFQGHKIQELIVGAALIQR